MTRLAYTSLDELNQVSAPSCSVQQNRSISLLHDYDIPQFHAALRAGYKSGRIKSIEYRKHQLLHLAYLLQDNRERFNEAVKNDLGRQRMKCMLNPAKYGQVQNPLPFPSTL